MTAKNKFFNAWENVTTSICKINSAVVIIPRHPTEILRIKDLEDKVEFSIKKPIVFSIPERSKTQSLKDSTKELVVAVSGRLSFEKNISIGKLKLTESGKFKTKNFGTNVEYFRVIKGQKNVLKFLCSVHYDYEPKKINHPIFHTQLSNKPKLIYETNYRRYHIDEPEEEIFQNFRIPSTQQDIFSALVQLSSDHLLSDSEEAFERLMAIRQVSDFFVSADFKSELNTEPQCMRSIRFFPDMTL